MPDASAGRTVSQHDERPSSGDIDHGRFLPGTILGNRYRVVARLGKGGMGEVYRADDLALGQAVGARRLAVTLGTLWFVGLLLGATHVPHLSELGVLLEAFQWALLFGGGSWLLYIAAEPHVRKRWPTVLISWNRVLAGRWNDPLVGRDVLIGLGFAALTSGLFQAARAAARALGEPDTPDTIGLGVLLGSRWVLSDLLQRFCMIVLGSLALLFLLLFFRLLLRRDWAAYVVVAGAMGLAAGEGPLSALAAAIAIAADVWMLRRVGLVAFAAMGLGTMLARRETFLTTVPGLVGPGLLRWALYLAVGVWAVRTVLQGRSVLGTVLGEPERVASRPA
ncbi:MAG TPA: hypothetical protein VFM29_04825 [Vicinamibacteria bacterium]|nr:hypothetical protein [Vicinamibacteria bacterium]